MTIFYSFDISLWVRTRSLGPARLPSPPFSIVALEDEPLKRHFSRISAEALFS